MQYFQSFQCDFDSVIGFCNVVSYSNFVRHQYLTLPFALEYLYTKTKMCWQFCHQECFTRAFLNRWATKLLQVGHGMFGDNAIIEPSGNHYAWSW